MSTKAVENPTAHSQRPNRTKATQPLSRARHPLFLTTFVLTSLACLIVIERLALYQRVIYIDNALYGVIGNEVLHGKLLYTEMWDHKPPAIFITYMLAEMIVGYSPHVFYFLAVVSTIVVMIGIYYAAFAGTASWGWSLFAAALWVVLAGDMSIQGLHPNTEVFINLCSVWAFALIVKSRTQSLQWPRFILIGVLFGLASLYKNSAAVVAPLISLAYIATASGGIHGRLRALLQFAIVAVVGAVMWAMTIGYFAFFNRFQDFYATFLFNRYYAGDNMLANLTAPLRGEIEWVHNTAEVLVLIVGVGCLLGILKAPRKWLLMVMFCVAAWVQIALPGQAIDHYYQLWLPPLIVGTAWAFDLLNTFVKRRAAWLPLALGVTLLAFLFCQQLPRYRASFAQEWRQGLSVEEKVAAKVNQLLAPDESFYAYDKPALYIYTRRRPPSGVFLVKHLRDGPTAAMLSVRAAAELARAHPEIVVFAKDHLEEERFDHPIRSSLLAEYALLPTALDTDAYTIFVHRGGKLEARLKAQASAFHF
jgi:hypothetical protein